MIVLVALGLWCAASVLACLGYHLTKRSYVKRHTASGHRHGERR